MEDEETVEQPKKRGRPKKQPNATKFEGFIYPAPKGYSAFPNAWFDEIISQIDNLAEQKIVLYVYRHTHGYQKPKTFVRITTDEFMYGLLLNGERVDRGTRMSDKAVRHGVKQSIDHGYVEYQIDGPANDLQKSYRLRYVEGNINPPDGNEKHPDRNKKPAQEGIKIPSGGEYQSSPQAHPITTSNNQHNQINNNVSTFEKRIPPSLKRWMEQFTYECNGTREDAGNNIAEFHPIFIASGIKQSPKFLVIAEEIKQAVWDVDKAGRIAVFFERLRELLAIASRG